VSAFGQGRSGILRCTSEGSLDVHATRESSSPIVTKIKCGDPILLIEQQFGSSHVRSEDGKDGYILGMNFGQWGIEPEATTPAAGPPSMAPTPAPSPKPAPVAAAATPKATPTESKVTSPVNAAPPVPTAPAKPQELKTTQKKQEPGPKANPPKPTTEGVAVIPQSQTPAKPANKKNDIKIHGYVTALNSPMSFDIEDYRITRDDSFRLEFDNASPDVSFKIEDVRVGTELEIRGSYDPDTSELHANSIKVDMEQFKKLKDTAIVDRPPSGVAQVEGGWRGIFFVNGQRIQVTPETKVVFKLTYQEKKAAKAAKDPKSDADQKDSDFRSVSSLSEVTSGMMMTYEGMRDVETGRILADRVEFSKNDFEKGRRTTVEATKGAGKARGCSRIQAGRTQHFTSWEVQTTA
jgi:hypothetical protein